MNQNWQAKVLIVKSNAKEIVNELIVKSNAEGMIKKQM
jgi:hypothetical protein